MYPGDVCRDGTLAYTVDQMIPNKIVYCVDYMLRLKVTPYESSGSNRVRFRIRIHDMRQTDNVTNSGKWHA